MTTVADVLVVGAGVIGLSTAVRLAEDGHRVLVWTAAAPLATTSGVAAAIWYPYHIEPADRVLAWSARTRRVLTDLAGDPASGVLLRNGRQLCRAPAGEPWWADAVDDVAHLSAGELPPDYVDGWRFTVPVIEMPVYLSWLTGRLVALGGRIEQRRVATLAEALAVCSRVVNAAGLHGGQLANDPTVRPVRGQVVRVERAGVEEFVIDADHPEGVTYVIPRSRDCVLGGTSEEGQGAGEPDDAITASIVRRCTALEPRLEGARVLDAAVGVRPVRPAVRLEVTEPRTGCRIVHHYGHGGAGVTVSWGCAEEAADLLIG